MNMQLSELICTRISHDLIGNVGAVGNAVELLEDGDMDFLDDIKSILQVSSFTLGARLKFFRMVFGLNNANLEKNDLVWQTLNDYLQTIGNKNFPIITDTNVVSIASNRYILLGAMILADLFVRGGKISFEEIEDKLYCRAFSDYDFAKEKVDIVKNVLLNDEGDNAAWLAPVFFLKNCAKEKNISIEFNVGDKLELIIG